ncbi:MAG: hypothetical protein CLLPBCKN_007115 [Chroococcidiopsis cubana SAG 39.79]|uniref:Phycocyanobilin:ferredoxin oxidoreductase n=1 Tax=Chroococcidiopsis cubana SAG 39.79 TaxID=388085 RepID=A0AB37U9D5_9CYAN|nr:hypothetical protein [Chroococcidiopsis cubana]MDZ4877680.1 hypothetical protein [Chroococcidiopsis cubana SAG 39.79]PSB59931.1 hypothetical protein C7B79_27680 [Chroococcidiopsis cubana CCALA 043]RUT00469.1 hypothetical protein DSM107010_68060 [Chroococcidiopsis cubana SAG 39.79]
MDDETADIQSIKSAVIDEFLGDPLTAKVEAAIFISQGRYFYKRLVETNPPTYRYKCLSPHSLRVAFNNTAIDSGWIAPGVVRCGCSWGGNWAVMFVPPARHWIDLSAIGKLTVPLPGLVLIGLEKEYWLCAVAVEAFAPDAVCFHAPLPNIYADLKICWGENKPPAASGQTISATWELFIGSQFSGELVKGKSKQKPYQDDIRQQLVELHRTSSKRYPQPERSLLPIGRATTIDKLVQEYLLDGID